MNNINIAQLKAIIKNFPCFTNTNIKDIKVNPQGLSHTCFNVITMDGDGDYFVKHFHGQYEGFLKELSLSNVFENNFGQIETKALNCKNKQVTNQIFTPRVIASYPNYIVYEFITGQSLSMSSLSINDKACVCINVMTHVHQIRADLPILNIKLIIDDLLASLLSTNDFNQKHQMLVNNFYQQFLQDLTVKEPYFCHGDLNFSNVILNDTEGSCKNKIQIIDFECACLADREFDIAMMIAINQLSLDSVGVFIDKYSQYAKTKVDLDNCLVTRYLYFSLLINGLWYLDQKDNLAAGVGKTLANQQFDALNELTNFDFSSLITQ